MIALTADQAREWAKIAERNGEHDKAAAWRRYADEQRPEPIIDGKMKAAGE